MEQQDKTRKGDKAAQALDVARSGWQCWLGKGANKSVVVAVAVNTATSQRQNLHACPGTSKFEAGVQPLLFGASSVLFFQASTPVRPRVWEMMQAQPYETKHVIQFGPWTRQRSPLMGAGYGLYDDGPPSEDDGATEPSSLLPG